MDTTTPRGNRATLATSALLAGLLPLVGNGLYAGPGSSGAAVLRDAQDGPPTIAYVAYPLEVAGFSALCVLLACLTVRTFRAAPVAAVTTAVVGGAMVAVKLASVAPMLALRLSPDDVTPATAALMSGIGDAGFVVSGYLLCLALAAAGVGLLRTDEPRWLAWWAVVAGALGVVAGAVGIVAPAAYVPVPFLLLLLWMVVTGVTTVVRSERRAPLTRGALVPE